MTKLEDAVVRPERVESRLDKGPCLAPLQKRLQEVEQRISPVGRGMPETDRLVVQVGLERATEVLEALVCDVERPRRGDDPCPDQLDLGVRALATTWQHVEQVSEDGGIRIGRHPRSQIPLV